MRGITIATISDEVLKGCRLRVVVLLELKEVVPLGSICHVRGDDGTEEKEISGSVLLLKGGLLQPIGICSRGTRHSLSVSSELPSGVLRVLKVLTTPR